MKVALIGYGKMGKAIEEILKDRNHSVVARFGSEGINDRELQEADVAIEFTRPEAAVENLRRCFEVGVPVVSGTTGWLDQYQAVSAECLEKTGAMLVASNFSLGVNIFFEINRQLARIMNAQPQYDVRMEEIHHTEKKDAPSGTAISLAEGILENFQRKSGWELGHEAENPKNIAIEAKRIEGVPGTHLVQYQSEIDHIEIKHTAHSRKGFALGAVLAAEFIHGKSGVFSMKDVLNF